METIQPIDPVADTGSNTIVHGRVRLRRTLTDVLRNDYRRQNEIDYSRIISITARRSLALPILILPPLLWLLSIGVLNDSAA
jgi:hypothetical protein